MKLMGVIKLTKCLLHARDTIYRDLPLQHLIMFLTVVDNPGITMPELADKLDIPQGTVSRNVKALGVYLRDPTAAEIKEGLTAKKKAGYDLLRVEPDMEHRKMLAVYPTANGMRLAKELLDFINV
jgi:hypothetical protein